MCNLNGRVPDEGMIVEAAIAFAAGKPLVLFKDDVRAPFGGYDNSMLTSLARGKIIKRLRELPSALESEISGKTAPIPLSDDLKEAVAYGRRISSVLEKLPEKMFKKRWPEDVIKSGYGRGTPGKIIIADKLIRRNVGATGWFNIVSFLLPFSEIKFIILAISLFFF